MALFSYQSVCKVLAAEYLVCWNPGRLGIFVGLVATDWQWEFVIVSIGNLLLQVRFEFFIHIQIVSNE